MRVYGVIRMAFNAEELDDAVAVVRLYVGSLVEARVEVEFHVYHLSLV